MDGLADVIELLRGKEEPTIIHTDQGSVYSSKAYNELIQDSNIVRSMSRAGKPTDNPVNEALNGWIKEELYIDFRLEECRTRDAVKEVLHRYVDFYNRQRPCFAIGYDTPYNYCKRFYRGELEHRDTFSQRIERENPSSYKKRRTQKMIRGCVSFLRCRPKPARRSTACQHKTFQRLPDICPLLKIEILRKYLWCLLLKKYTQQKMWLMSTFENENLKIIFFRVYFFLTGTNFRVYFS